MKRLFVRVFLAISSVALLVLLISASMVFFAFQQQSADWGERPYEEFCDDVARKVNAQDNYVSFNQFIDIAYEVANYDDRISGLLFRDDTGAVVYSAGTNSTGSALGHRSENGASLFTRTLTGTHLRSNFNKGEDMDPSSFQQVEVDSPITAINMGFDADNQFQTYLSSSYGLLPARTVELPNMVQAKEIAGSLMIFTLDAYSYSVDVLTFTPDTYGYTSDLFHYIFARAIFAAILCVFLAFFISFLLSRVNQKYVKGIEKALRELADGQENVDIPKSGTLEFKQINKAVVQLDEALSLNKASRKAWLRNISHDMNTPVASMRLLLDGMMDGFFPLEKQTLLRVSSELDDLSSRISRVREYAGLQSPDKKANLEIVPTNLLIATVMSHFEKQKDQFELQKNSSLIECDEQLMASALIELLNNALSETNGTIVVTFNRNEITVSNTGKLKEGIDFFAAWERGDSSRTSGGNGLGLSMVSQIMRLHNGKAQLSEQDGVVTAYLSWPSISSLVPSKSKKLNVLPSKRT